MLCEKCFLIVNSYRQCCLVSIVFPDRALKTCSWPEIVEEVIDMCWIFNENTTLKFGMWPDWV